MQTYFMAAQIVLAIALIIVVLLQAKGQGLSGIFGGSGGVYKTRRGVEKTLFNTTVVLAATFMLISLLSVALS